MSLEEKEDTTIYKVVLNQEEQYSIWPAHRENPLGWRDSGTSGNKTECLTYIKQVWTDMRPLSLRKKMEEMAQNPPLPPATDPVPQGESLVDRLCAGDHPVVVSLRPEPSVKGFKDALDSGYVRIRFTNTKGNSELGLRVDNEACDLVEANFDEGTGQVRVVGNLSLDYTKVRCIANIDLKTLDGVGHLEKVEAAAIG